MFFTHSANCGWSVARSLAGWRRQWRWWWFCWWKSNIYQKSKMYRFISNDRPACFIYKIWFWCFVRTLFPCFYFVIMICYNPCVWLARWMLQPSVQCFDDDVSWPGAFGITITGTPTTLSPPRAIDETLWLRWPVGKFRGAVCVLCVIEFDVSLFIYISLFENLIIPITYINSRRSYRFRYESCNGNIIGYK